MAASRLFQRPVMEGINMADTNEMLQQAIAAARAGKSSEAKVLVDRLIQDDPDNPHALFLKGMLADSEDEQLEYMNQVLAIDPGHKAAAKRLAQLEQRAQVTEIEEVPEEVTEEAPELAEAAVDETLVSAAVMGEEVLAEEPETEEPFEIETEFVEEAEVPLFEEEEEFVDEALETELFGEVSEPMAEEAEEVTDEGVAETIVAAAVVGEAIELEEPIDEEIPDWLFEEAEGEEELLSLDEEALWDEAGPETPEPLPDWLQEEPTEEMAAVAEEDLAFVAEEPLEVEPSFEEALVEEEALAEVTEEPLDLTYEEPIAEAPKEPAPAAAPATRKRKKSPNRGLEILLAVLIIVALLVVGGLVWVILSGPF